MIRHTTEFDRRLAGSAAGKSRSRGSRLAVAGIVALALASATAVALLPALDGSQPPEPQAPPWGFVGGWQDYCYQPITNSPGYDVEVLSEGESCPSGWTRFGTAQQIELTARAGATIDRLAVFWNAVEPDPPVSSGGRRIHIYDWGPVMKSYRAMLAAGIRPVVLASGTPEWARQKGWRRPGACRARHGKACSYPPAAGICPTGAPSSRR